LPALDQTKALAEIGWKKKMKPARLLGCTRRRRLGVKMGNGDRKEMRGSPQRPTFIMFPETFSKASEGPGPQSLA
jgi:hypothetical protein